MAKGVMRESNSRPPAPKAGIIPLDQSPIICLESASSYSRLSHGVIELFALDIDILVKPGTKSSIIEPLTATLYNYYFYTTLIDLPTS